ncbi:MAG TPA: hypothetical protein VKR58_08425 [Aquella sp.]|nr:hypothetical protein [Aquella sp.]
MPILSEYLNRAVVATGTTMENIKIVPFDLKKGINVGNLVIREYYTTDKEKYTYMKETAIVTKIINNSHPIVKIKLVVNIENGFAYVNPFAINLIYKNGKYYQIEMDIDNDGNSVVYDVHRGLILRDNNIDSDSLIVCEKIDPIIQNQGIPRYYVEDSIVLEEAGKSVKYPAPSMEIPSWC